MVASMMDGKLVATEIKHTLKKAVTMRSKLGQRPPGLAVIQLGHDSASSIYVTHKRQACLDVGFHSFAYDLPANTPEHELLALIDELNEAKEVDGILVQLPLPAHIRTPLIIERIKPTKDVDGFHPYNLGRLAQGNPLLRPCTPYGVMTLLKHYQLTVQGQHAVVVGASNIVGRPMALELLLEKATITLCNSHTQHLERHVRMSDIIIVATGIYDLIKPSWLNEKQILIDIGMQRRDDGRVHGEINFMEAKNNVGWITPVPGGVGPMTIATLLQNTLTATDMS